MNVWPFARRLPWVLRSTRRPAGKSLRVKKLINDAGPVVHEALTGVARVTEAVGAVLRALAEA
ncbi:MAG: hypothetical protein K0S40_2734 [Actinomycetospora sp.]|nr:hypothetical protein [Actinomycetospora sp.]